jgi:hypothetical protein
VSRARRQDAGAIFALVGLVGLLFFPVLFTGRVFYDRDIHAVWWSQTESFVRCIASGSWPLWDPFIGFGQPMLANPSAQVAYPPTWLNLFVPLGTAYTLYVVGHLLLAGVGLYVLGRHWDLSRPASLVAAAIFVLSGPLLSMVSLWHHLAGACWMPWVVLAADRTLRVPEVGRALAWGALWSLQLLAGSADMCALSGLVVVGCAIPYARTIFAAENRPRLVAVGMAAALAIGLSAVQWWPTVDIVRHSARWGLRGVERGYWSLHPLVALQALLPALPRDVTLSDASRERFFEGREPFIDSVYLGLAALPVVALGLASPRRVWARALGALVLGAFVVALGRYTWVYDLLAYVPPVRMLRYPVKAIVLAAFGWALLAALGLDAWRERRAPVPRVVGLTGLVAGALALGAAFLAHRADAWAAPWVEAQGASPSLVETLAPVAARLATAGALVMLVGGLTLASRSRLAPPRAAAAAAFLVVADLVLAHHDLNPTAPATLLASPPIVGAIKAEARLHVFDYTGRILGRVYRREVQDPFRATPETRTSPLVRAAGAQAYLYPPTGRRFGFYGSYDQDLLSLAPPYLRNLTLLLRSEEETAGYHRLLRLGSVDNVVALHDAGLEDLVPEGRFPSPFREPIRLFRVPDPLPRAYVVAGVRVATSTAAYQALVDPAFDPAAELVLPTGPSAPADPELRGEAEVRERGHDRLLVEARLDRPGFLVLTDAYDPGWRATADGRDVEVRRANVGFRALALPAGRHRVELLYRPRSVTAGLAASAVSLAGLLVLGWRTRARNTVPSGPGGSSGPA